MPGYSSTELADLRPSRRSVLLALLALGGLAGCGKKGTLRLPEPGETDDEEATE
jgi:predicted small lipoprotein YifL